MKPHKRANIQKSLHKMETQGPNFHLLQAVFV
jgi:hypothetical protein